VASGSANLSFQAAPIQDTLGAIEFEESIRENSSSWHTNHMRAKTAEFFFGFDMFVSYARSDGQRYAETLEAKLESRDLTVFRDLTHLDSGEELSSSVMTAIRRSRRFVLIDTPGARGSKWVAREIEAALAKRSPGLISIRIGDTSDGRAWPCISDESLWARIDEFNWEHEPASVSLDGNPSENVVERIRLARSNIRARAMFRNAAGTLVLVLTGLLIFSVFQTRRAIAQRELATARQLASESDLALRDNFLAVETSALLAAESVRRRTLPENDARIREALRILPTNVAAFAVAGAEDRTGGYKGVAGIACSPDGRIGIVATQNGRILAYRFPEAKLLWEKKDGSDVTRVVFSPDGGQLASSQDGNDLVIRASGDGRELHRFPSKGSGAEFTFSPDGHSLAVAEESDVKLIESEDGHVIWRAAHRDTVNGVAFSGDGRWIASVSVDHAVSLIDARNGRVVQRILHPSIVNTIKFSPDGRLLVSGSFDNRARLIEVPSGKITRTLVHLGSVESVAFSPDSKLLATGSQDHFARVFDTATGAVNAEFPHRDYVQSVDFDKTGRFLATGSSDRTSRVFDVLWNEEVVRAASSDFIESAMFVPGTETVFSATYTGQCRLFTFENGTELGVFRHAETPVHATLSDDGALLAISGPQQAAAIYRVGSREEQLLPDVTFVTWLVYGRNNLLAAGTYRDGVRLFLPASNTATTLMAGYTAAGAFSADGQMLAALNENREIALFKGEGAKFQGTVTIHTSEKAPTGPPNLTALASIAISPNKERVVAAGEGGWAGLYATTAQRRVRDLKSEGTISLLAFSPDGQDILVTDSLGNLRATSLNRDADRFAIRHESPVGAIAFSHRGDMFASAAGKQVRVFSYPSASEVSRIPLRSNALAVEWGADDRSLHIAVVKNHLVAVEQHTLAASELIQEVCRRSARSLAPEEWRRYLGNTKYESTCPAPVKR
jgi:WD40 repeat protein